MNKLTVSVIGAIAGIALVLGVLSYNKTPEVVRGLSGSQGPRGEQGLQGPKGDKGDQGPVGPRGPAGVTERVGSVSSPDIMSPYFSYGGVRNWAARRESLIQASSTICAIQGPAATSTLRLGAIRLNTSTTSATIIDMAKDTTPYATTTKVITTINLAANAQLTAVASTTLTSEVLFAPNEWFVVKMVGATLGTSLNAPVGVCEAAWIEI